MNRGKYIVIEGNDGTGKSTQIELLAAWLYEEKGIETFVMHEPGGIPIADAIRTIIKNGELKRDAQTNLLLFTASRRELWMQARDELKAGKWVLSARNYLSTIVYQGYAEGLTIDLIRDVTLRFTDEQYLKPDYTVILSLTDEQRNKRINQRGKIKNKDTFESRGEEFQKKLNQGYKKVAEEFNLPLIDASYSIEEVQRAIQRLVEK